MSYGSDGSDSSSSGGYGGDSSDSSSSGGYGGDSSDSSSSGGYGGDSSDSSSSGGYGGDSSDSSSSDGYGGDSSDSDSGSGYGGDGSESDSSNGYGSDSSESDASSGYSGDDSVSSEDNNDGNYGSIAGDEYSDAASNDETDTTGAVADSLSFTGDSYDAKGLNEEGITGGEPCSYDVTTDFTGYSIDDYTQSLYTYDTSAEATETTMNDIENTINNAWNNYVAPAIDNIENIISETYDKVVNNVESFFASKSTDDIVDQPEDSVVDAPENSTKGEVGLGTVQAAGGVTELGLGIDTIIEGTRGSNGIATGAGIALGGYLAVDGASNIAGGISRMVNGLLGTTDGDTYNFVKNAYIAEWGSNKENKEQIFNGENLYNATQLAVGGYSLYSGVASLCKNTVNVESSYLGYEAVNKGTDTWSNISSTLSNINYSEWTTSGLMVKAVDINLGNIGTRISNFVIDGVNTKEAYKSISTTNDEDEVKNQ